MAARPFRFGVNDAPGPETAVRARRFEALGYDVLLAPDRPQLPSPLPILAAAAAVTDRIGLGTYVLAASLHEPHELVRQLKALQAVAAGRFQPGFGAGLETRSRIELPCPTALSVRSTMAKAQSINMTAHHVVALERTLAAPRGPKAVWLPAPPKAPARSAALPLWSRTTTINTRQLATKNAGNTQNNQRESASLHPAVIIPTPTNKAIAHFIQPGIYKPH